MTLFDRVRLLAEHGLTVSEIAAVLDEEEDLIAEMYPQAVHRRRYAGYRPWELAMLRILGGEVPLEVIAQALARTPAAVRRLRPGRGKARPLCPFCATPMEMTMPPVAAAHDRWGRIERCLYCPQCNEVFLVRHEWERLEPAPPQV